MKRIIDYRFLLTPFAIVYFTVKGIKRKYYYVFGFKIIDIAL